MRYMFFLNAKDVVMYCHELRLDIVGVTINTFVPLSLIFFETCVFKIL